MYQCEECNYESFYKFNVDRHVAAKHKHLKVQVHQTENCDYKSMNGAMLNMHVKSLHVRLIIWNFRAGETC